MVLTREVGQYQASQAHTWGRARLFKPSSTRIGVILISGINTSELTWFDPTNSNGNLPKAQAIANAGYPIISIDLGALWGNDTASQRITDAVTYGQSNCGFASGKVILIGASHGTSCVLNWAKANPTLTQAVGCLLPLPDIQYLYDNDTASLKAGISTAYGGRPDDAHNPASNASSFTMPVKLWYSTADEIALPDLVTDFATATGAVTEQLDPVNHAYTTLSADSIPAWLNSVS